MKSIEELLFLDPDRMRLLIIVADLKLPDGLIAAGFVRNLVWDHLHGKNATPLNDVDVIFYDASLQLDEESIRQQLAKVAPDVNWEVKNQARMHLKHGDQPYKNTADAMSRWPEKETAVGVCVLDNGDIHLVAPFGVESLFKGFISHNPYKPRALFEQRIKNKNWLAIWPKLQVVYCEE